MYCQKCGSLLSSKPLDAIVRIDMTIFRTWWFGNKADKEINSACNGNYKLCLKCGYEIAKQIKNYVEAD